MSNAGLDNNVSRQEVFAVFEQYGKIEDIIMVPRKPYCFVYYSSQEEAVNAYTELNGYLLSPSDQRKQPVTLYILYVEKGKLEHLKI